MKLSILVCSVHTRRKTFLPDSLEMLYGQYEALPEDQQKEVEIIYLIDNKTLMLGTKRNYMVDIAQGQYVVFVDDDDLISEDYIRSILKETYNRMDCIVFDASVSINGEDPKTCVYSMRFEADSNHPGGYERLPNHICAIKKEIVTKVNFPTIPYGEDSGFSKEVKKHLQTESRINRVLYFYKYNSETTETQQHLRTDKKRLR